eukprot:6214707-Pleurochrysis_carterae.AAC.3
MPPLAYQGGRHAHRRREVDWLSALDALLGERHVGAVVRLLVPREHVAVRRLVRVGPAVPDVARRGGRAYRRVVA